MLGGRGGRAKTQRDLEFFSEIKDWLVPYSALNEGMSKERGVRRDEEERQREMEGLGG